MMNAVMCDNSIESLILETVKDVSLNVLQEYAGDPNIARVTSTSSLEATTWKVVVLIVGPDLKIILRAHFSEESGRRFAQRAYARNAQKISLIETHGFMRELCNLVAGRMKGTLEANKLNSFLSVPCVTIDTLIAGTLPPLGSTWVLGHADGPQVIFNATLELTSDKGRSLSAWISKIERADPSMELLWPKF